MKKRCDTSTGCQENGGLKALRRQKRVLCGFGAAAVVVFLLSGLSGLAQTATDKQALESKVAALDANLTGDSSHFSWDQVTVAFAPEYFYWQENINGAKVLDESGPRYGLELSYKQDQTKGWLMAARLKAYYGSVDYNGQTQGGTSVKTTTDYYGGLGEIRGGYRWGWGPENLDLMGGIGLEDWERVLNGPGGYSENWMPLYFKAGVEISPKALGWIATLGLKVPIYTVQRVDMSSVGFGSVTLHPGSLPSGYGEAGYQFTKNISLVAYVDSYWFAQSGTSASGGLLFYQPESFTYQVGVRLGWTF